MTHDSVYKAVTAFSVVSVVLVRCPAAFAFERSRLGFPFAPAIITIIAVIAIECHKICTIYGGSWASECPYRHRGLQVVPLHGSWRLFAHFWLMFFLSYTSGLAHSKQSDSHAPPISIVRLKQAPSTQHALQLAARLRRAAREGKR